MDKPLEDRQTAGFASASSIQTWRERLGLAANFPLHVPSNVEWAMEAEIAALRTALTLATQQASAIDDGRQVVVVGGQRVGKQQLLDLQRDAGRYRWLRDKADDMGCTAAPMVASLDEAGRVVDFLDGDDLDAAVDTLMLPAGARRKLKLVGAK